MSMSADSNSSFDLVLRTTQIIMGALIAGVTIFIIIVLVLVHVLGVGLPAAAQQPAQMIPILTYLSAGAAIVVLPLSFIVSRIVAAQTLRTAAGAAPPPDRERRSTLPPGGTVIAGMAYRTGAIVGGALSEGAAFFAAVAYLLEHNPIALVAFAILWAAMVLQFPTRGRIEGWIVNQEEVLRQGSFR